MDDFETEKYFVAQRMRKYGGSFVTALGEALSRADETNSVKIKIAFREYWKKYAEMGHKAELAGEVD